MLCAGVENGHKNRHHVLPLRFRCMVFFYARCVLNVMVLMAMFLKVTGSDAIH